MNGNYYYLRRDGEVYGPAVPSQLIAAAGKGIIQPSDELSTSRAGPWRSAGTCVDLWVHTSHDVETDEEIFIVWEGPQRHGPFSRRQLHALLENDQLSPNCYVADEHGRLTPLGRFLGIVEGSHAISPARKNSSDLPVLAADPAPTQKTDQTPVPSDSTEISARIDETVVPPAVPPQIEISQKKNKRRPKRRTTRDSQKIAMDRLLREELSRPPLSPAMPAETKSKRTSKPERKATRTDLEQPASTNPQQLRFIKTVRAGIRSKSFRQAYLLILVSVVIQAVLYLVTVNALITSYLVRTTSLAIEVFAPFGSDVEQLQESDLVFSGISAVCLCAELLLPIFFLIKSDADFRMWAIATGLGVIVSLSTNVEELMRLDSLLRGVSLMCGIGIASGGIWIASRMPPNSRWMLAGLACSMSTAGGALYLSTVKASELLVTELGALPPVLRGESTVSLIPVGVALVALWLPVPLYCLQILSSQADESTHSYIKYNLGSAIVLAFVGLLGLGFLGAGPDVRYLSVPLAFLPMTVGSVICSMALPVMWILHPEYTAR